MGSEKYFRPYVAAYLVLEKDNSYLLGKRKGGWKEGWYGLPSGHLEEGETLVQALVREVKEEIDIDIKPKDAELKHILHRDSDDRLYIDFFFTCKKWGGEPKIMEPEKCSELAWFPKDNLPENLLEYIKDVFNHIQTNTIYSEYGWD
jgi:8-oxo-dGTP diphosphatase